MLRRILYTILSTCVCVQVSVGQSGYFKNNPFPSGASDFNSGYAAPSFFQEYSFAEPLNKEKNFQIQNDPSTSTIQASFPSSGPFSTPSSSYQISSAVNPSPVESFTTEFNTAVYTSASLPDIFDLRELSAEAFSKYLYDYVYARGVDVAYSNPHYIASVVAMPIKEGIDTYTSPVLLDIYANAIAKYLFSKGTLNVSNATSLARKYAKVMEECAERHWAKETPESKFFVLADGFREYMASVDNFSADTIEDMAVYFANEVKRVANKS